MTSFLSGAIVSGIAGGGQVALQGGATNYVVNQDYMDKVKEISNLQKSYENGKIGIDKYNSEREALLEDITSLTSNMSTKQQVKFDKRNGQHLEEISSEKYSGEALEKRAVRNVKQAIKEKFGVEVSEQQDLTKKGMRDVSAFIEHSESGSKIYIDKTTSKKISKTVHELVHQARLGDNALFTKLAKQSEKYLTQEEKAKISNFIFNDADYMREFDKLKSSEEQQQFLDEEITARAIEKALGNKKSLDLLVNGNKGLFNKLLGKIKETIGVGENRLIGTLNKALLDAKDVVSSELKISLDKKTSKWNVKIPSTYFNKGKYREALLFQEELKKELAKDNIQENIYLAVDKDIVYVKNAYLDMETNVIDNSVPKVINISDVLSNSGISNYDINEIQKKVMEEIKDGKNKGRNISFREALQIARLCSNEQLRGRGVTGANNEIGLREDGKRDGEKSTYDGETVHGNVDKESKVNRRYSKDISNEAKENKPKVTKKNNTYDENGMRYNANQITVRDAVSKELAKYIEDNFTKYQVKSNKETVSKAIERIKNVRNVESEVNRLVEEMKTSEKRYNEVDFLYMDSLILACDKLESHRLAGELLAQKSDVLKEYGQAIQGNSIINKMVSTRTKMSAFEKMAYKINKEYEKKSVKGKEITRRSTQYQKGDIEYFRKNNLKELLNKYDLKLTDESMSKIIEMQKGNGDFLFKDLGEVELKSIKERIKNIIEKENADSKAGNLVRYFVDRMVKDETDLIDTYNKNRIVIPKALLVDVLEAKSEEDVKSASNKVMEEMNKQNVATIWEKIDNFRMMSMLANAKTHLRNYIGNVLMRQVVRVKTAFKAGLEKLLISKDSNSKWHSQYKTATLKFDRALYSKVQNQVFDNELFSDSSKYHENNVEKKVFNTKCIEWLRKFNYNMLSKEDAKACKVMFSYTFTKWMLANNYTLDQVQSDLQLKQVGMEYAIKEANRATFKEFSKLANKLNDIQMLHGVGQVLVSSVMPFKRTPINIAKQGIRYSPLGLAKTIFTDISKVNKGEINVNEFCDNLAMGLTGTSIMALGIVLSKLGLLRLGKDDDKEYKYNDYIGKQKYSITIGNTSFTMDWLSPSALPLFTGVALYENMQDNEGLLDTVSNALLSTFDPLTEMTMLQGIDRVISTYQDNEILGALQTSAQNYVSSFIPTMLGQLAKTIDPTRRDTTATNNNIFNSKMISKYWNTLLAKVPALSMLLEPYVDVWGNEVKNYNGAFSGFTNAMENVISPTYWASNNSTSVDKEIQRLYLLNGDGGLIPTTPRSYYTLNGKRIDLTSKEYTAFKKAIGNNRYKALENLFNNNLYKKLTDEEKSKIILKAYDKMDEYSKDVNTKYKEYVKYFTSVYELNTYYLLLANVEGGKEEKVKAVNTFTTLSKIQRTSLLNMLGYKTK